MVPCISRMSSDVRIARIITRLNIGGPAIQALTLSSSLGTHGFQTLLAHGQTDVGEGDMRSVLHSAPYESEYIASLGRPVRPARDLRALWAIYRMLGRFQPSIVHTHTAKAGTLGRLAMLAYNQSGGRKKAKAIHTYHGHVFEGYFRPTVASTFIAIERQLARHTDIIITISPRIRDDIVNRYGIGRPDQVRVVPLGFDLARFLDIDPSARAQARQELDLSPDAPVITTVGRLAPIKRHDLFLKMAAKLKDVHRDATFLIVGDGALRDALERQAADLGIANRVRFLGWRGDLPTVYAATDLFALTSDNEGTPVALIEAIASGVASVSTDVGGVRDVIADQTSGLLIRAGDAEGLADAVSALLKDETTRARLAQQGRSSVRSRFGFERLVRDLTELYREVLT